MVTGKAGQGPRSVPTLDVRTRAAWRKWLMRHHATASKIWLVFHKLHTGKRSIDYEAAIEEALCFGWVDSLVRRLDDARFARKFTPRTEKSGWSAPNKRRYASLAARGLLAPAGLARSPSRRTAKPPRRREWPLPAYMERALKAEPRAWKFLQQLAPGQRRKYVGWVDSAKRPETKERRLREAVERLARGEKLGLK